MEHWTERQIPDLVGRTAVVTGANSGLGFEVARELSAHGAHVVMACRSQERGASAAEKVEAAGPRGSVEVAALDLADLGSVAAFAAGFQARHGRLDVLVNNAGIMTPPFSRTKQGFEMQFGVNHLGHFALTGQLLPTLLATPDSRVTTVTSTGQHIGRIELDDLNWERRKYRPLAAYGQSKLANVLFTLELQNLLAAAGAHVRATTAHPGWSRSNLSRTQGWLMDKVLDPYLGTPTLHGARPILRAATDPYAAGGSLWSPTYMYEHRGPVGAGRIAKRAQDADLARRLWEVSVGLTNVDYAPLAQGKRVRA
ncbi:oxidoreductase [Streptomyces sp. NPDC048565]|uniref:oxidoreductase n=1 Tax=Streptomyces sp. NPDC048565 TaxID=3155266 RepID=UPI003417A7BD